MPEQDSGEHLPTPDERADQVEKIAHGFRASSEGSHAHMMESLRNVNQPSANGLRTFFNAMAQKDEEAYAYLMHSAAMIRSQNNDNHSTE